MASQAAATVALPEASGERRGPYAIDALPTSGRTVAGAWTPQACTSNGSATSGEIRRPQNDEGRVQVSGKSRASRLHQVLRLLEATPEGRSAQQLKRALEPTCSLRTIYRLLHQLRDEGILYADRGLWTLAGTQVIVELAPALAGRAAQGWHPTQHLQALPHGGVYVTFRAADLASVAARVASLGGQAQAVEPAELIMAVVQLHRRGIETHRDGILTPEELRRRGLSSRPPRG